MEKDYHYYFIPNLKLEFCIYGNIIMNKKMTPTCLHVKWAPSVWEPPSSIVSHTMNNNKPKNKHSRKNLKQGHKGKHGRKKDDNNKQHPTPRR